MPLLYGLGILLVMGSVTVWLFVLDRLRSGPILEAEPRTPVAWRAFDLLVVLIVYLVAQLTCFHLTTAWMQVDTNVSGDDVNPRMLAASLTANAVANVLVMLASILYLRLRCGLEVGDIGFKPWRPLQDLTIGLLAFIAAFAPVFAIQ